MKKKIIAFYLPQFHSIPENDLFFEKGFTEWNNLKNCNNFIIRPHKDIGYYNLLNFEVRKKQSEIAKKYGLYGFCYYHYWFNNKKLLEKPLELMLKDGYPDIPFCLCWANMPWKKIKDNICLVPQVCGGINEWENHINYLLKYFKNKNYIKIDNCPIFLIYKIDELPNLERYNFYKSKVKENGFSDLLIIGMKTAFDDKGNADSFCNFFPASLRDKQSKSINDAYLKILNLQKNNKDQYFSLFTGWDNSPRRKENYLIYYNSRPETFGHTLQKILKNTKKEFVFVNGWNEWSEGACLEPSEQYQYKYLESLKHALNKKFISYL